MADLLTPVVERIDADLDASVERLKDLLRIPSISTDPAHKADTRRAAEWCSNQLEEIGFVSKVHDTPGHPMVVAHFGGGEGDGKAGGERGGAAAPRVLYYGHYDVQPPDPMDLWESEPFEPVVIDSEHGKRIVARGAVDDKGQLMTFIEAFRAWMSVHGKLPFPITVMLEGEEESGSPSLDPFLEANRDLLAADVCMVSDTSMWDIDTPAVTYMLRGLAYVEVTLHGPSHDLHSGSYGGGVVNPNVALARVIAQLHDDEGRVQIPGFYDDVRDLSPEESAQWKSLGFDEEGFLAGAGLRSSSGEAGRSLLERLWSRPTCDVNGMWGGYTGAGAKTVIPAKASAKVSCRLVADQDPAKIYSGIVRFFEDRTPADCRWEILNHGVSGPIRVPTESSHLRAAMAGLKRTFGRDAVLIGCGGSIPVVGSIQSILGFDSLLVGFGLDDDRVHSPNEKFELRCFEMGIKAHAAIVAQFAEMG